MTNSLPIESAVLYIEWHFNIFIYSLLESKYFLHAATFSPHPTYTYMRITTFWLFLIESQTIHSQFWWLNILSYWRRPFSFEVLIWSTFETNRLSWYTRMDWTDVVTLYSEMIELKINCQHFTILPYGTLWNHIRTKSNRDSLILWQNDTTVSLQLTF